MRNVEVVVMIMKMVMMLAMVVMIMKIAMVLAVVVMMKIDGK